MSRWKNSLLVTVMLLAAVASTGVKARAQEGAPAAAEPETPQSTTAETLVVEENLPYVPKSNTIATKLPVPLAWTPANVGLVESARLEAQGARELMDALSGIAGVNVQSGAGVFDYFLLRGVDSLNGGLILTDGAPEPESSLYPLYNVERVEVFKGPAGFLYGGNPLAGAVNLVRKQPVPGQSLQLSAGAGSYDGREGRLDWNVGNDSGTLGFRLNGLYREGGSFRDGIERETTAVNPSFVWRPKEGTSLNFSLEAATSDFTPDAGLPLVTNRLPQGLPRERNLGTAGDFSEQDLLRGQLDFETTLAAGWTLRDKLYFRRLEWDTEGTLLVGVTSPFPGLLAANRVLTTLDDRQEIVGNQLEATWTGTLGGFEHRLLVGLEASRATDEFTLDAFFISPVFLPSGQEVIPGGFRAPLPGQRVVGDAESTVIAPYVVDQITLSERFQLLAGVRWDDIQFEDPSRNLDRSDGEASPILGAVFQAAPNTSIYTNLSGSFAPPSPRATGALKPERSQQVELGLRQQWLGGRLHTTAALYQLERENIPIADDNGFTEQIGDQRSRGLELELAADLGRGFRGFLSYAYTDAELTRFQEAVQVPFPPFLFVFDRSGNEPAFVPDHLARLWLTKSLPAGFSLSGGARWVGTQFIAEENAAQIPEHVLVDAQLGYELGAVRLFLHGDNLTDEEYETRGFGSQAVIPGDPRRVWAGVELRLGGGL